jgi:hypothetical protein
MTDITLVIRLGEKMILSARSESEGGILSFHDNRYAGLYHGATRKLAALFDDEDRSLVSEMDQDMIIPVSLTLMESRQLYIFLHDGKLPAISDAATWWMPLEDCTLDDILQGTGLSSFAEPVNVANPFRETSGSFA